MFTVLSESNSNKTGRRVFAKCECGNIKDLCLGLLKCGNTTSCGCVRIKKLSAIKTTHGLKSHPLYITWKAMRQRCTNPNASNYKYYGARGISICPEWQSGFKSFHDWSLANGWIEELKLDRINNDNGYSPENCRWITHKQNCRNKSICKMITHEGITLSMSEWCEKMGRNYHTVRSRINNLNWNPSVALLTPTNS